MIKRKISLFLVSAGLLLAIPAAAMAHVVVKPAEVGVSKFQTFTTGVPNEKDAPTIQVRLVIPEGLNHVSPNVKPGWQIEIKKSGEGEDAKVTEIIWSGGSIPSGFRDEFVFSAQAPKEETSLNWKAYQTYQDGEVVAWDQEPKEGTEESKPYSVTKVIKDLGATPAPSASKEQGHDNNEDAASANGALALSGLALVVAFGSLYLARSKK